MSDPWAFPSFIIVLKVSASWPLFDLRDCDTVGDPVMRLWKVFSNAWLSVEIMMDFPGGIFLSIIDLRIARLAVSVSAEVLCRSVVLVDGTRIHPVLTISFVFRSIRTKEPPPAGSSSKKIPCCLSSRVSLM